MTLSGVDKFKVSTFYVIIDQVNNALKQRIKSYSFVQQRFGFLTEFDSMSDEDIKIAIERLVDNYPKDLSFEFYSEFCQFICWYKEQSKKYSRKESTGIAQHIFKLLHTNGVCTAFPNAEVIFRIYSTYHLCLLIALESVHFHSLLELRIWSDLP